MKHVLDALAKDPSKLEALVSEHNQRVREFNGQHLDAVHRLDAQLARAREALTNLVKAIEEGSGPLKTLAEACAKREAEVAELERQIEAAKAELQPYLMPKARALTDFVSGTASMFTGDFQADRAFVDRVLEAVRVHADGNVVLHFRKDSLFGPLAEYEITNKPPEPQEGDVHADGYRSLMEQRLMHRLNQQLKGMPDKVVDFGGGVVARYEHPRRKTSGVPSGI